MFDVYMNAHAIDPRTRRRFAAAMSLAVAASVLALGSYVGGQRFAIRRVDAPRVDVDVLLASVVPSPPAVVTPPPRPEPPATKDPVELQSASPVRPEPDEVEDVLERPRPRRVGSEDRRADEGGGGTGETGPKSPPQGVPCPIPGTCTTHVNTFSRRNTDTTQTTPVVPLSQVRARLRFSPDPSRADLLRTSAGQRGQGGTSVVSFCIDTEGRVDDVRTKRSHGDREIDRICRDALSRWRFSPMQVRGKAHRTCSEMTFVIAFE